MGGHSEQVPPALRAEIERASARLALVSSGRGAGGRAAPGSGGWRAAPGGAASAASRDRTEGRWILVEEVFAGGALPTGANSPAPGAARHALRPAATASRARHQQGRQPAAPCLPGGTRRRVARLQPDRRLEPVRSTRRFTEGRAPYAVWASWRWHASCLALWRFLSTAVPDGAVLEPTGA